MTRRKWLVLIAGVLALLIGGRMGLRYLDWQASQAQRAAKVAVPRLQSLATAACICAREKGEAGEAGCWQQYKAAIADFDVSGVATACAPISTELDCITTAGGEECIVTSHGNGLCTAEEAAAADRAWTQALNAEGDISTLDEAARARADKRANAALRDVTERIRRGERITAASGPGSCV
ncbi:MAG: hypothetical protein KAF27_11560 [Porphyrobacter sp.]|nr:hypothetical protein [Porphyrobacter sp.]